MDESIQVASIIDKLPPTWRDVMKNLKHRKDDMSLKELGKHLIIEEQYRLENKTNDDASKVHVVEEKGESSKTREKRKHKDDKGKDKFKKNKKDVPFSLDEEQSWWVDSGTTRHVCNNRAMFKTYEPSDSILYIGNHSTTQVQGIRKVDFVFTSGNNLTLNNVFHVPNVRKNLMFGSILSKFGFKLVFESDINSPLK
ncbi:hypothetical protein Tco_0104231 [Tanacetum coccineum]